MSNETTFSAEQRVTIDRLCKWLYGLFAASALVAVAGFWFPNHLSGSVYLLLALTIALVFYHLTAAIRGESASAALTWISAGVISLIALMIVVTGWPWATF